MPTNSTSTQMSGNSDNLLGSFGFDATQMPSMQQTNLPLHNTEVSLLDLGSPTEKNGLFIFSLMLHVMFTLILHVMFTLMFTCTADAKLINVNSTTIKASSPQPSLWMDPQLCEVDMTPGRKPSLPVAMAPSPQQHRLSSSAQTILNCLPDLSFMLVIELIAVWLCNLHHMLFKTIKCASVVSIVTYMYQYSYFYGRHQYLIALI